LKKRKRMPATVDNIRFILYDIKYSWWFRFWGLLWLAGFIVSLVALGVLGRRAEIAGKENDFHVWYENASELYFPRFHFRISSDEPDHKFISKACFHAGIGVNTQSCQSRGTAPSSDVCFAVVADSIKAQNHNFYRNWRDISIECEVNTTIPGIPENLLIAWEFEGDNHAIGEGSIASVWIAPTNSAWVLLNNDKLQWNGVEYNDWRRRLVYHSSESTPGVYRVATIIDSYFVSHIESADSYTGWMALGEVGGFGFFMVILQGILMLGFGFCFTNNSKFLGGDAV